MGNDIGRRGTVLVVEDDGALRDTLTDLLEDEGFRVAHAATSRATLDWLAKASADVVLLDYFIGGESAETILEDLVARAVAPPVVMVSAAREAAATAAAYGIPFVTKPFDVEVLLGILHAAIARNSRPIR